MTRVFFLLLSASLAGLPWGTAHAQQGPAARPVLTDSAAAVAREDTAIALQRLFFERRRTGLRRLVLSSIVVGADSYVLAANRPETTYQRGSTGGLGLVLGYFVVQLGSQLAQAVRYRPQHEKQLVEGLDQGKPLPPWLRKKLTAAYFGVKATAN